MTCTTFLTLAFSPQGKLFRLSQVVLTSVLSLIALSINVSSPDAATITAVSCGQSDVQNAIVRAVDGDTVIIPGGTCTWTAPVGWVAGRAIKLIGSGAVPDVGGATTGGTTINLQVGGVFTAVSIGESATGNSELSNITFRYDASQVRPTGGLVFFAHLPGGAGKPIIMHHVTVHAHNFAANDCGRLWMLNASTRRGVVYRNIFRNDPPGLACSFTNAVTTLHLYPHPVLQEGLWNAPSTLGVLDTNGEQNFYFETNHIENGTVNSIDVDNGSRSVIRYNVFRDSTIASHGRDSSPTGVRQWEIYNNTFIATDRGGGQTDNLARWILFRGGTGVVTDNVMPRADIIVGASMTTWVINHADVGCPPVSYPWLHQVGWGFNGSNVLDANGQNQQLDPVYFWNNYERPGGEGALRFAAVANDTNGCGTHPPRPRESDLLQEGRDYFNNRGPKPGYEKYQYPHPLALAPAAPSPMPVPPPPPAASLPAPSNLDVR